MFYKHLRKVREMEEGAELKAELHKLTLWIDEDPKLFTGDIIYSILLTYRDIQVRLWLFIESKTVWLCMSVCLLRVCVCVYVIVCVCVWVDGCACVYTRCLFLSLPHSLPPSLPPSLPHSLTGLRFNDITGGQDHWPPGGRTAGHSGPVCICSQSAKQGGRPHKSSHHSREG